MDFFDKRQIFSRPEKDQVGEARNDKAKRTFCKGCQTQEKTQDSGFRPAPSRLVQVQKNRNAHSGTKVNVMSTRATLAVSSHSTLVARIDAEINPALRSDRIVPVK